MKRERTLKEEEEDRREINKIRFHFLVKISLLLDLHMPFLYFFSNYFFLSHNAQFIKEEIKNEEEEEVKGTKTESQASEC